MFFSCYLSGRVQVLQREKIKVDYRISHLSKLVRMISPQTKFSLAIPSPSWRKNNKIDYWILCCCYLPTPCWPHIHPLWSLTAVATIIRCFCPPFLSAFLSKHHPLSPPATRRRPLTVIVQHFPPPGEHFMRQQQQWWRRWQRHRRQKRERRRQRDKNGHRYTVLGGRHGKEEIGMKYCNWIK